MWLESTKPMVILAPMDGFTEPAFRRFVKAIERRVIVFSEFLPATIIAKKPSLAKRHFRIYQDEKPVVIQLYGKDVEDFKTAARLAEEQGAAGIDINMGCPAKKVVAHRHGSALMKEIDLACAIIEGVKSVVKVPVTVKTRLGWEDSSKLIPFALRLQDCGLDAITVHGRTYHQKFEGEANYQPIWELKKELKIPVFGNGDIDGPQKAVANLGNLDGLMVGRAAIADPWIMGPICDALAGIEPDVRLIPFQDKVQNWKDFATMSMDGDIDELRACRAFRKYLVRIVADLQLDADVRREAVSVETLQDIHEVFDRFIRVLAA